GSGPDGRLDYHLQMSATPVSPNATNAPNLLSKEFALPGMNTSSPDVPYSTTESVGPSDTCDTYTLSVGVRTLANLQLTGLSNDADIRLIRDLDSDRVVDGNEVMAYSRNGGIQSESIPNIGPGDYFVQIYSYDGNPTNYTLSVSHSHFV
ncbi:MAG TPA: PPC domain-containing protein, partial [Allocoleopsis sp.]